MKANTKILSFSKSSMNTNILEIKSKEET